MHLSKMGTYSRSSPLDSLYLTCLHLRSPRAPRPAIKFDSLPPAAGLPMIARHMTTIMAKFTDLPHELLLRITSFLNDPSEFLNLARSCRKLLSVGRERLYTTVDLGCSPHKHSSVRTLLLLRTVLGSSSIAKIVRDFRITYAEGRCAHEHGDYNHRRCVCPQSQLRQMIRAFFAARFSTDSRWILEATQGKEPALVGIPVAALPQLRMLDLDFLTTEARDSSEQGYA